MSIVQEMAERLAARGLDPAAVLARMTVSGSSPFIPPPPADSEALLRQNIAAALAGGIIAASGRPHTVAEAIAVWREVLAEMAR